MPDIFHHHRQDGNYDDRDDDQREILFDEGDVAEEISGDHAEGNPENGSADAEGQEARIVHGADTGHEGCEGAEDRHEAGDDDRDSAVLFIEGMSLVQIFPLEPARILLKNLRADETTNPVVGRISANRSRIQHRQKHSQFQRT